MDFQVYEGSGAWLAEARFKRQEVIFLWRAKGGRTHEAPVASIMVG
jgi:hypothetical protein